MNNHRTLTLHAADRSRSRGIPIDAIEAVIDLGKHRAVRGADVYTLGWREVRRCARRGIDLAGWEGIEVVCAHDGQVLTTYRNKNPWAFRDRAARRPAARRSRRGSDEEIQDRFDGDDRIEELCR
jgi:hypothetical protein